MSSLKKTLLGWVGDKLMQTVQISSVEVISEHFRMITMQSESLMKAAWAPGEKIQINVGDWNVRTYTPLSIDQQTGKMRIVVYIHGNGPGSKWASEVKAGDECQILGPRESVGPDYHLKPIVVFGDETSLALGAACRKIGGKSSHYHFVFEVSDIEESHRVCWDLDIAECSTLVQKTDDGSHLNEICAHLQNTYDIASSGQLILTGNEKSIRTVRNRMREKGFSSVKMKTKVYWAKGRTGID